LQNNVLRLIDAAGTNFYLTGGTALSRCYLHHRYSDDLDFFVNDAPTFQEEVLNIQKELDAHFFVEVQRAGDRFRRLTLSSKDGSEKDQKVFLKIEFINDVPFHFGDIETTELYSKVDNPLNILSNKITAIMDRDEPKDFADLFAIAEYLKEIDWRTIFVSAASKSAGIFAPLAAEKIARFDFNRLDQIKWVSQYDWKHLIDVRQDIVRTIVGLEN
jgi:predicted nucleotidyltransferase component of viral defense system